MNRRRADIVVGLVVGAVLLFGGGVTWQAYRVSTATDGTMGSMMDGSFGGMHGPNPIWLALGTLLVAAIVAGLYLTVREDLPGRRAAGGEQVGTPASSGRTGAPEAAGGPEPAETASGPEPTGVVDASQQPRSRVLDILPEDERRVLEPVIDSPGITQIELRDRSDFSKSKVSQTVSDLEKRGLLYRERQGRTYRVYPSDELQDG